MSSIIELTSGLWEKIESEGARAYPNECCGILFGRDVTGDGDFALRRVVETIQPVLNEFEEEEQYHRFLITPQTLMKAEKHAAKEGLLVLGFYHSHPDAPAKPSEYDRQHAWLDGREVRRVVEDGPGFVRGDLKIRLGDRR